MRIRTPNSISSPPAPRKPSLSNRLWIVIRAVLRFLAPHLPIPGHCRYCWTRLELIGGQVEQSEGGYIVRETLFWKCPRCEDRTSERATYIRDLDIWEHS
ncbi:MAG: hypothetical protein L0177_18575 [Chloroflexi bacterium]|nr:hypothetical protein [Chloroflexota bacterium]